MELINRQYIKKKWQSQQEGAVWKNQIRAKSQESTKHKQRRQI